MYQAKDGYQDNNDANSDHSSLAGVLSPVQDVVDDPLFFVSLDVKVSHVEDDVRDAVDYGSPHVATFPLRRHEEIVYDLPPAHRQRRSKRGKTVVRGVIYTPATATCDYYCASNH